MRVGSLLVVLIAATPASAHPLAPSLLDVRALGNGRIDVVWKVPQLRAPGADASPVLPDRCRPETDAVARAEAGGIVSRWRADCGPASLVGERLGVRDVDPAGAVVRVVLEDGRVVQGLVVRDRPWFTIPPLPRPWDVLRDYARLGVGHILAGPDHLLFVLGLVLLARSFRRIAATVTAFTLGHSVTLSLAALGLIRVRSGPIEVAIAASVFVLAVELARDPAHPTAIRRRPWFMAALFGLLHGLGFAAALAEAGLPEREVPLALFAFNVGIEAGQLVFVAAVLAARALVGPFVARLPRWSVRLPVYAMGSLAAFWLLDRTLALLR
jgi:hydrogenase/urease accessory protein HupE